MLDLCPLCVAEVYALRCDAMRAGTSQREEIVKNMRAILTVLRSSSYKEGFTAILSENEVFFNKF